MTSDNGTTHGYGYYGNVTSGASAEPLRYNTSNQVASSGYGYDGAGNLTSDPANGTLSYNDVGQLISVSNAAGSGSESFSYAGAS